MQIKRFFIDNIDTLGQILLYTYIIYNRNIYHHMMYQMVYLA